MVVNPLSRLDADVAAWIASVPDGDAGPDVLDVIRSRPSPLAAPIEGVTRSEYVVSGEPAVRVRVFSPDDGEQPLPCLYVIHGGGYISGSYNDDSTWLDMACLGMGFVGVSVDYRLAPETTYPGALEDCYRGLRWTMENAEKLGIDPARTGIFGASAGGGLAAAVALLARDRGECSLAFQVLLSPMLDDRQITESSQWEGLPVWSRRSNTFGWRSYLGPLYGSDAVPYTAAPARATDLSGLPPTFIGVGAVDGFVDEDADFALRLNRAGVATELHVYSGACHGFDGIAEAAVSRQSRVDVGRWLSRYLRVQLRV